MTCKECIHYDLCETYTKPTMSYGLLATCNHFKNIADFAEVRHGEWVKHQKLYGVGYEYVCSVCEKGIKQYEGQPICSECGAKMDG